MNIVEYAENALGLELFEYQKIMLYGLEQLPRDQKLTIIYPRHNGYVDLRMLYEISNVIFKGGLTMNDKRD